MRIERRAKKESSDGSNPFAPTPLSGELHYLPRQVRVFFLSERPVPARPELPARPSRESRLQTVLTRSLARWKDAKAVPEQNSGEKRTRPLLAFRTSLSRRVLILIWQDSFLA